MAKAARLGEVRGFIGGLHGPDLHAKRVDALAGAMLGVMTGASLAVAMIGQALAQARGLVTKHTVSLDALASGKQVDRLLSNAGTDVWDSFARWVPQQVGAQPDILVAMDWTDFDHDGQSTLVLSLVTGHGRAAPLIWLSVWKKEIATRRNDYENACLRRLAETVPAGCRITILADRGFGDQKLFAFLAGLDFGYLLAVPPGLNRGALGPRRAAIGTMTAMRACPFPCWTVQPWRRCAQRHDAGPCHGQRCRVMPQASTVWRRAALATWPGCATVRCCWRQRHGTGV